ncbi:MAG: manganese efflux pump MntP family protein [Elusimicrobiota bacterium]|jgi:putative Mn2+ efflux pump MntP|nr:manganese efflux pump MntP family protein [Elusimicrobiota bacterium]
MSTLEVILIAASLSMDNMAVAAAVGCGGKNHNFAQIAKVAAVFALAGIICLITGWLGGVKLRNIIASWDHWAAFLILCYIGVKMLKEASAKFKKTPQCASAKMLTLKTVATLALATNIDVLAAGVSLALYEVSLIKVLAILAFCIIAATAAGFALGQKLGNKFGAAVELSGGTILIALGLKILIEGVL